ncbi:MAG: Ig-like domain repeat protein [Methanobrevibacter sp.]|uniref:Ig-like domain repeat protein n=1 Tax=Methanobrevibacter sp. TaxID=66852 RepID=UPI0025D97527|nr:Ig-like domain repeat protein [Methanobrevibacter sp.]MBR0270466.1 Ig-like domain repeat protein [Methanobrevibacter sp.]
MFVCLIVSLFVTLSCASASDVNNLDDNLTAVTDGNDIISVDDMQNNEIMMISDDDVMEASDSDDLLTGTYTDLNRRISNSPDGSTIYLNDDYSIYSAIYFSYRHDLIIDGQGHTIDANGNSRIFHLYSTSSNITFKNIKFINGYATEGGAIYSTIPLNVINCTFEDNEATASGRGGGAIYFAQQDSTVINITDSTFRRNTALQYGGAIEFDNSNQPGYIANIKNCVFEENTITGISAMGGGAILVYRYVTVNIDSTKFINNSAKDSEGGAIRYSGTVTVNNSEFYSNNAIHGGALCFGQIYALNVYNSKFVDNYAKFQGGAVKARDFDMNNVTFINNTADEAGGALFSRSGVAVLADSQFINNTAPTGAGLFIHGDVSSISVVDTNFTHNIASANGGGLYSNTPNMIAIAGANFINNLASNGGGAYIAKGRTSISVSKFEDNTASAEGGAIYIAAANNEVINSNFKNNTAQIGGAVYWNGDAGKLQGSTFISNNGINGSSVYWRSTNGNLINSNFDDTDSTGKSLQWHGTNGRISESRFIGNDTIFICQHASVSLDSNTQTSTSSEGYSVFNEGIASFASNTFNNLIYNNGTITSDTYIITLNNDTLISDINSAVIYTSVEDDNGNYIKLNKDLVNVFESQRLSTSFNNTHYVSTVNNIAIGYHNVSADDYAGLGLSDVNVMPGGILYLIINLTVNQTNYGEKVVFTTTVVNTTYNGTVDLAINDIHYNVTLINGTAVLTLYNMAPNTYDVIASYMDYNQTVTAEVEIKVELRNSTLSIIANNVYYGNITTINITVTNGTTGTVYVFVNNKMYILTLANSTAQLNLTGLSGNNYTAYAIYNGDSYFYSSYNQTSFTVYKHTPQINITVSDIHVGEIATIKVNLPSDITGTVFIDVDDDEYRYVNKSSITLYVNNLTAGNISVRVHYLGDNKYYEANNSASFNVTKKNMTIIVQTAPIPVGENETISVILPSDAKGLVLLDVNGTKYYAYANNTVAKFIISGLSRGVYNVTAEYAEGPIYNTATNTSSFFVYYIYAFDFNVSATTDSDLNVYVSISLPSDVDGDVVVEINGSNYTAHISKGKATVMIPNLNGGAYNGTVYLENDTKYGPSNRTFIVDLERVSPTVNVIYNSTIYVDDDAIIKVTVDSDATGNITITINNTDYTEKINNGEALFNITGLVWHEYAFNVTYTGDRKYLPDVKEHVLTVSRIHNYYSMLETESIYVGENATIKVTFEEDTTGNVTLLINGSTYIINLKNGTGSINISGLPVGKHTIDATYSGDSKYEPCHRVFEDFYVRKIANYDFTPNGQANDTHANITVELPADADGYVNITINGQTYPNIEVKDCKANLTVGGLSAGVQYPVKIDYSGNNNYEPASKNITLRSDKTFDYEFNITINDIHVGDIAYLVITIPEANDTDLVRITVENRTPVIASIVNGTINHPIIGLEEGDYSIIVEYLGNSKFEASTRYEDVHVSKISSYKFDVVANEPKVGENLTVDIQLPTDSSGNVTVTVSINNTNYTANVTNGTARVVIPNLPEGIYNTTVFFSGDNKYHNATKVIEVTVVKIDSYAFDVTPENIYVGSEEHIKITLPEDITGNVTITIDNTDYINKSVTVVNGTGWFNVTGLAKGQYVFSVAFDNDSKYESDIKYGNFEVLSINDYLFNVTVSDPNYVRDNITFKVELPTDATGEVNVRIFATDFKGEVKNGVAVVNITAPYYGSFPYLVSFEEPGKYVLKTQSGTLTISKLDVDVTPEYNKTVHVGEKVTFKVQLPEDATGTITIVSRIVSYTVPLVNGSANVTIDGYPLAQSYSPAISYSGDDRYNPASLTLNVTVIKVSDYDFDFNVSDINVGQTEIVNVTLPSDATDDVLIYGNFSSNRYSQAIINGNVTFNIRNLAAGTYNITVLYQGYNKYESKNITKTFTVSKVNSTIAIDFIDNSIVVVSVPGDATGNVTIRVGSINRNVTIANGKATLDVTDLYPDTYTVYANYAGDGKYLENATDKQITLPQTGNYLINATANDIIVGENATIIVYLPSDAKGYVNITVNNSEIKRAEITNGVARLTVPDLAVGNYKVVVNFTDDKYLFKTNSTTFNVAQIRTVLSPSVIVENRTLNITVDITENATGNITIYVDNVPYSREIKDNKANLVIDVIPGDIFVRASYAGDDNHTSANSNLVLVEVEKIDDYDILIDLKDLITVVENNVITFTLPENVTSNNLIVFVEDDDYIVEINSTTHKATLTLPLLPEGDYDIVVPYEDDLYDYKEFTASFIVIKLNTTVDVEVKNITKDMSEVINITLNDTASGEVLIDLNGTVYHKYLENGKANLTVSDLTDGNYTVIVTYLGDNYFNDNSTTVYFTVSKLSTDLIINASDIIVGHDLKIEFTLSSNITDIITVKVGNENYTTFVYKGKGNLTVRDLPVGEYNITASYAGDNNYYAVTNTTNITVNGKKSSKINVSVADITVGEDIMVYVNATEGIYGPVYVTIGGLAYTHDLVDGKVNFTVSNLTARNYQVSAFFMGNDEFELCNTTSTFVVHKKDTPISLNVTNIKIGEDEIINVTVAGEATGDVLIDIDDLHIYAEIINGSAVAVISDFAVGKYNVTVNYLGDDKYNANSTSSSFTVSQLETTISISGSDIIVGQREVFDIVMSANITEVVIVEIGGVNYTTFVEKGVGKFSISNLTADVYDVVVYFPGNTKYGAVNNTTSIKVSDKLPSAITINVSDIFVGDELTVYVNVTPGATGRVTVVVAGDTFTKELSGDSANFTISGLIARDYHVTAYYRGDDVYLISNSTANFTVNKKDTLINASAKDIIVGEATEISVNLTDGATGIVLVDINGTKYYANITDSKVILNVPNLAVGSYDVVVSYLGDDRFHSNETETSFKVSKVTSEISISLPDGEIYAYGDNVVIHVTGPEDVTGVATLNVVTKYGHDEYTVYINNGEASLTIIKPDVDDYNVSAVYLENYKYYSSNSSKLPFEVYMNGSEINVNGHDISVGETETIVVTFPIGEYSGNVTFYVDEREFTREISYDSATNISTATLTLDDLVSGTYTVRAVFVNVEDGKTVVHEGSDVFTVSKIKSAIVIDSISDIKVGENATIRLLITPSDVTGTVDVYVNSKHYSVNVTNPILTVSDLKEGEASVYAVYPGDSKYLSSNDTASFNVYKNDVVPELSVSDIDISQMINITVKLPGDATGYVLLDINGTQFYADVENGTAKYLIVPANTGEFVVTATYLGDDKYYSNSTTCSFVCSKIKTDIIISGENIVVGHDEVLTITTANFTEVITVEIEGINYTTFVENGIGNLTISNLPIGNYNATVYFPGNTKYNAVSNRTSFEVTDKKSSALSIDVKDIIVGQDAVITVNVTDGATGEVTIVIRGREYTEKLENGSATFTISNLTARDYEVTAIYSGDESYLPSNNTAGFAVEKIAVEIKVDAKDILVNETETIEIRLSEDIDGIVLVNVNSTGYYVNVTEGYGVLKLDNLKSGDYNVTATFLGDDVYKSASNATSFAVSIKSVPEINVDVNDDNVTVVLPEDATGNVTVLIDGKEVPGEVINNTVVVDTSNLAPGNHTVEVIYPGDDKYAPYDNTTTVEVPKVDDYKFDVDIKVDGNDAVVSVELPEDVNGVVFVDVDGTGYYVNVTNGKGSAELTNFDIGKHNITVRYDGDDKYGESEKSSSFVVDDKHITPIDIITHDIHVGDNLTVYVIVPSDATGEITIQIDSANYTAPINRGVSRFNISGLAEGNYTVNAIYNGSVKYDSNTTSAPVKVSKVDDYPIDIIENGKNITINLPSDATGNVTVIVDGENFTGKVVNGTVTIYDPNLTAGPHNITVIYSGDDKYSPEKNDTEVDIKNRVLIDAPYVIKYYSGPERLYVYLEDLNGNKIANASVSIKINGVTYNRTTDENGTASLAINLGGGNYSAIVTFNGNEEFNSTSITSFVSVLPTIYGNDIVKVYRNGTQYYALFLDSQGNPLVNENVSFNINGVFYTRTTNESGWAKLNINLQKGTYILTAFNPVTGEKHSNLITVLTQIVENNNLIKYYHNDSQFVARIITEDGSYAKAGEQVTFNIHGMIYNRYTDNDGYVRLNINLGPGDYIITTYYKECAEGNHIHILEDFITNDLVMSYKDGSQFIAHVLDGKGNAYEGQTVTFNINGMSYDRTTDINGDARLNINLQSGQYLITSTYLNEVHTNTIVIN